MKNISREYKIFEDDGNYKNNTKATFYLEIDKLIQEFGAITIYYVKDSEYEDEKKEKKIYYEAKYTIKNEKKEKKKKMMHKKGTKMIAERW